MKKIVIAMLAMLLTATAAHAEHKLLITDVLDQKEVEGQALFEYSHRSGDVSGTNFSGEPFSGKAYGNAFESVYSLGVGLGHGLELSASIPYVFSERVKVAVEDEAEYEKGDGVGDLAVEAKYRLLGGEHHPYTVVTGLGVKFDTAGGNNAGTQTTDVSPFIAASANLQHHHIPYAIYRATLRNHGAEDTHTLSLGLEKEFNHTVTLDAKIDANFNTATRDLTGYEDFVFELTSYIQVAHNFYLLPSVAYLVSTDATSKETGVKIGSTDGFRGGMSLYYLW